MTDKPARPLIIPGGQRCGSTWLLNYLATHPRVGVRTPVRPEPKVFLDPAADAHTWWTRCSPLEPAARSWVVEKSTSYLEHPECAERIRDHLRHAHVLIILRDPTERAISNWRFSTAHGHEQRPLTRALDPDEPPPEPSDRAGTDAPSASPHHYLPRGHYAELLAPWLDRFEDSIDVVVLEDLLGHQRARQELWDRLGLGPNAPDAPGPINESTDDHRVNPEVRKRLHRYFAPHQAALERQLCRALPWPAVTATTDHRS